MGTAQQKFATGSVNCIEPDPPRINNAPINDWSVVDTRSKGIDF
jgi:hypothetical protein